MSKQENYLSSGSTPPKLDLPGVPALVMSLIACAFPLCATTFLALSIIIGEHQTPSVIARWLFIASGVVLIITLAFDCLRRHSNMIFFK